MDIAALGFAILIGLRRTKPGEPSGLGAIGLLRCARMPVIVAWIRRSAAVLFRLGR